MRATVQHVPLTLPWLVAQGLYTHADSRVTTVHGDDSVAATYGQVEARSRSLAAGLRRLGVAPGDRVGTLCANHQPHLEAYLAVPGCGAVLHTLNERLHPEQLSFIISHGGDRVLIADARLLPLLAEVLPGAPHVERVVVVGKARSATDLAIPVHPYDDLIHDKDGTAPWTEVPEDAPAVMCYTSGTTGNPKGVVYDHRSMVLHAFGECMAASLGLSDRDRLLPLVPMFHANAWGLPHSAWLTGADLVLPGPDWDAASVCRTIARERVTVAAAVPTVWNDVLHHAEDHDVDLSSLRMILCGGSAVPLPLMRAFDETFGVPIIQAWGMTETGPLASLAHPHGPADGVDPWIYRNTAGRVLPGVEVRVTDDDDTVQPRDGVSVGEIEARGHWVTAGYHGVDADERFHDGWLRTGDVGTIDEHGYIRITDRAKDVIKSGGEWISSVELEGHLMAHPDVVEAAVVGVPDARWQERPLACVVVRAGATVTPEDLRAHLEPRVARWWLPENWTFVDAVPRTSVGKFDKKALRQQHAEGDLFPPD